MVRIWSPTTFSKNRERLLAHDVAAAFFDAVVTEARGADLLSDEHFTVDSTQLEAWASLKSLQPRDTPPPPPPDDPGNPTVDFHGQRRTNQTHQSTTDPDARLFRKGGVGAVLSYLGHVLLDNRHGLVVNTCVTAATGTAQWEAAEMLLAGHRRGTVGADKNYDVRRFVRALRAQGLTPHVAAKRHRSSDDPARWLRRTSAPPQARRAGLRLAEDRRPLAHAATPRRGTGRWTVTFAATAYNMVRLRTLLARA